MSPFSCTGIVVHIQYLTNWGPSNDHLVAKMKDCCAQLCNGPQCYMICKAKKKEDHARGCRHTVEAH